MTRVWASLMFWLLSGCALESPTFQQNGVPEVEIAWPAAPLAARIRYLYSFDGPAQLGYRLPFANKLRNMFAGDGRNIMVRPYAIGVSPRLIAVADPGAGAVHLFDTQRKTYRSIDAAGQTALVSPVGITLGDDRIYVADSVRNRVFEFDESLQLVNQLSGFVRPTSLAYDHKGQRLFVTDTGAHKILAFNRDGQTVLSIGERGKENGQFNYPSHIAIAGDHLYVNDSLNFRAQVFDLDGHHVQTFGVHGDSPGYLAQPKGIGVNSSGDIFITEAVSNRIQVFNLAGDFLLDFGSSGEQPGTFQMPSGIAIANDTVYVADSGNRRVQVFQYLGEG